MKKTYIQPVTNSTVLVEEQFLAASPASLSIGGEAATEGTDATVLSSDDFEWTDFQE